MFPGGSPSHPHGAEEKGDDEHADAGKKQVQETMHHDAQDAQRHCRDHQEEKQDGLCKTLVIVSRRALSETSKTDDTPYQIMSNGFSAR
jgi:hypothetical protein